MQPSSRVLCVLLVLALTTSGSAQTAGNREPTFEQRLVMGLQLRIPSEFAFVQAVIDTVNRGELPVKVVDRVFFWARMKVARRRGQVSRRAIIYFQPALTLVAQQLGVQISPNPSS